MSPEEIKYILKMQDDTKSALKSAGGNFDNLADAVAAANKAMAAANGGLAGAAGKQNPALSKTAAGLGKYKKESEGASKVTDLFQDRMQQATAAIAVLDGPLGGVASRFSSMGTLVKAAGFELAAYSLALASVIFVMRQFMTTGAQFESQMLTISNLLRITGKDAVVSADQINQVAYSIAESTNATVAGARDAATRLLAFGNVGTAEFERVLRAAQDLAAVGFSSMEDNVAEIGKVLQDPARELDSLREKNIFFTQSQADMITALIESGDSLKAYDMILKQIEATVGGSAVAAASGATGSWNQFTDAITKFVETFTSVSGVLDRTAAIFRTMTDAVSFLTNNMDTLLRIIGAVFNGLLAYGALKLAPMFLSLAGAVLKAGGAFKLLTLAMAANPIGLAITAVAALVAALTYFKDTTISIGGETATIAEIISFAWGKVKAAIEVVGNFLAGIGDKAKRGSDPVASGFQEAFGKVLNAAKTFYNYIIGTFVALGKGAYAAAMLIKDVFTESFDYLGNKLSHYTAALGALVSLDFEGASAALDRGLNTTFGVDLVERLKELGSEAVEDLTFDYIGAAGDAMAGAAAALIKGASDEAEKAAKESGDAVGGAVTDGIVTALDRDKVFITEKLKELTAKLSPSSAQAKEYASALRILNTALKMGLITQDKFNQAVKQAEASMGLSADAIGQSIQASTQAIQTMGMEANARAVVNDLILLENAALKEGIDLTDQANRARLDTAKALIIEKERLQLAQDMIDKLEGMRQAIELARFSGPYADADKKALEEVYAMRKKGVEVTLEMADAVREYYRAMQEAAQGPVDGFDKWMVSLGTFQEGIETLKEEGIGGLSDAITDALTGAEGSWQKFIQSISRSMIKLAVDQLLKDALGAIKGVKDPKAAALDRASAAITKLESLGSSLTTSQVLVNAANVTVNGSGIGAAATAINDQSYGAASGAAAASGVTGTGSLTQDKKMIQEQIWAFFAQKGLQPHQISGIMGNIQAESAFNPTAVGDGGNAFGLAQWNDRSGKLFESIGGKDNLADVEAQLKFMWEELQTTEKAAFERLMASQNVDESTAAFVGFERPQGYSVGNPRNSHNYSGRLGAAEDAMAQYGQGSLGNVDAAAKVAADAMTTLANTITTSVLPPLQQAGTAAGIPATPVIDPAAAQAAQGVATAATNMVAPLTQAATALQNAGSAASSAAIKANTAAASTGAFAAAATPLPATLTQAATAGNSFNGVLGQVIQQMLSAALGPNMGGIAGSLIGGIFHEGGKVGSGGQPAVIPSSVMKGAPRFHSGLKNDEYAAILQKGERVLTRDQDKTNMKMLRNSVEQPRSERMPVTVNYEIHTKDAGSFRRSQGQIDARTATALSRAQGRRN